MTPLHATREDRRYMMHHGKGTVLTERNQRQSFNWEPKQVKPTVMAMREVINLLQVSAGVSRRSGRCY